MHTYPQSRDDKHLLVVKTIFPTLPGWKNMPFFSIFLVHVPFGRPALVVVLDLYFVGSSNELRALTDGNATGGSGPSLSGDRLRLSLLSHDLLNKQKTLFSLDGDTVPRVRCLGVWPG